MPRDGGGRGGCQGSCKFLRRERMPGGVSCSGCCSGSFSQSARVLLGSAAGGSSRRRARKAPNSAVVWRGPERGRGSNEGARGITCLPGWIANNATRMRPSLLRLWRFQDQIRRRLDQSKIMKDPDRRLELYVDKLAYLQAKSSSMFVMMEIFLDFSPRTLIVS